MVLRKRKRVSLLAMTCEEIEKIREEIVYVYGNKKELKDLVNGLG